MNVIFDLDGTLVNSAPGILSTLNHVVKKHNIRSSGQLSPALIGPPLREMLCGLCGPCEDQDIELIEKTFKAYYDETGVLETTQYSGITEMLADLSAAGHNLFLATNKRMAPTRLLMKYFLWEKYFLGVYSLDSFEVPMQDKAALLERVMNRHSLLKNETIYIGDRPEDYDASKKCDINFMHATWGYGEGINDWLGVILKAPNEISDHLAGDLSNL
jgi:phosphoglycolate phosphatase